MNSAAEHVTVLLITNYLLSALFHKDWSDRAVKAYALLVKILTNNNLAIS